MKQNIIVRWMKNYAWFLTWGIDLCSAQPIVPLKPGSLFVKTYGKLCTKFLQLHN